MYKLLHLTIITVLLATIPLHLTFAQNVETTPEVEPTHIAPTVNVTVSPTLTFTATPTQLTPNPPFTATEPETTTPPSPQPTQPAPTEAIEVTADATLPPSTQPPETPLQEPTEGQPEVTVDPLASITPTATLGGIPMSFVEGKARYQNRGEDNSGIEIQIMTADLTLLSVTYTEVNGTYSVAVPTDRMYWVVAYAPLYRRHTRSVEIGEPIPNILMMGGDINGDTCIGAADLDLLMLNFDQFETPETDINNDGKTDIADMAILTGNYQTDCEALLISTPTPEAAETPGDIMVNTPTPLPLTPTTNPTQTSSPEAETTTEPEITAEVETTVEIEPSTPTPTLMITATPTAEVTAEIVVSPTLTVWPSQTSTMEKTPTSTPLIPSQTPRDDITLTASAEE